MALSLDFKYLDKFIRNHELSSIKPLIDTAHKSLHEQTGAGNDFLGWLNLASRIDKTEITKINNAAETIKKSCGVLLIIGIGGSYLGARAAIEFLRSPFYNSIKPDDVPQIYFVGNNISTDYLDNIAKICQNKDICINVISKSGTTTEPAIAFRYFRKMLIEKYGETESAKRIFCTTDANKGTLKNLADDNKYETFVIPDDVGGRFSVLTPVGLLPIAVAGFDIKNLLDGAKFAEEKYANPDLDKNDCYKYAAYRNIFYNKGKAIEVLVSYEPALSILGEWFKQLYGESEGKDHKGIFPASMTFSTDLHSLGQFVQDGSRNIFETVISIEKSANDIKIEADPSDFDGLNFLADMSLADVNKKAMLGTILAHTDGGVPNIVIEIPQRDEKTLGELFYFFEKACAISGYMLGVNPFDQPGVEDYKKNMFALLGKPGFEDRKRELEARL